MVKIDLGCGLNKKGEDYIGVDYTKVDGVDIVHNLNEYPWPFEDNSVDEIFTSHYVEHIPHNIFNPNDKRDGLIQFMDECYRILKVGGKLTIQVPFGSSIRAFQDPTHERFLFKESFYYFNNDWRVSMGVNHYGIKCDYDMIFSYFITNEMTLKSQEVRDEAFLHDWNVIDDLRIELTKK
jgi:predicted SAM-dependent methyltransferase